MAASVYQISADPAVVNGYHVSVSGTASANPCAGKGDLSDGQQLVSVDWGETATPVWETANLSNYSGDGNGANCQFTTDWNAEHVYSSSGTYTVKVKTHHNQTGGSEASDEFSVAVFDVYVPPLAEDTLELCTNGINDDEDQSTDLEDEDCDAYRPRLTVVKVVEGDGPKVASDFNLFVNGSAVTSEVVNVYNATGTYTITEDQDPNYTPSFSVECPDGLVALDVQDNVTCTLTNTYNAVQPSTTTLTIIKQVVGSTTTPSSAFEISVRTLEDQIVETHPGSASGADYILPAGDYIITEDGQWQGVEWLRTFSGDCTADQEYSHFGHISLTAGVPATCTITNTYSNSNPEIPTENTLGTCSDNLDNDNDAYTDLADPDCAQFKPRINVTKLVVGGEATSSDFTINVQLGESVLSYPGSADGVDYIFNVAGNYSVNESAVPNYLIPSFSGDCEGSIAIGEVKSCTITNTYTTVISQCEEVTTEIVSDETNEAISERVGRVFAQLLSFIHSAWTASISGASWIWETNPVTDPENTTLVTFTKDFYLDGTPLGAHLFIASDNNYEAFVNDVSVGLDSNENNYSSATQDEHFVDASLLVPDATNTIKIVVTNIGMPEAGPQQNPAGLLYKLVVTSEVCPEEKIDFCPNIEGDQAEIPTGYHLDEQGNCVVDESNDDDDEEESGGDTGGSSETTSRTMGYARPIGGGQVLGIATTTLGDILGVSSCDKFLNKYIKFGAKNDSFEVKKLQIFLNLYMNPAKKLDLTGVYDAGTMNLVKKFQVKEWQEVLAPWVPYGLATPKTPTGYVFKTTQRRINNLMCPILNLPIPDLGSTNRN